MYACTCFLRAHASCMHTDTHSTRTYKVGMHAHVSGVYMYACACFLRAFYLSFSLCFSSLICWNTMNMHMKMNMH